ncbi:MAG: peptide/nickel transport system permease protein [Thermoanaerobacterium sp.]|uniref:ABC transporter permease n=2 Tax=Thermoanaerobacterium thermosaccharolyticum TaxID=1517 RepID=UPI0024AA4ECC|nr:peptide/nickel transport system permease protein [Thermoanaerobacterium sp.]
MKNNFSIIFKSSKFRLGFIIFALLLLSVIIFPIVNKEDPLKMNYTMFQKPGPNLPLGADNFGRNELVELIAGGKTSLIIGILAGGIATGIGLILGLFGGYIGGLVDDVLSSITNIFLVIPSFIILVLISVSISSRSYLTTALVIGFTSWPWTARAVRAQTISLRNRDHVNLAKVSGYSIPKIIATEILPYIASYVGMAFILQVASGILSEATISMLGLGPQNTVTLGLMLNWATMYEAHMSGAWWAFVPPVLMIALITFSLNLMNTGLDQIFNPQIRS